MLIFGGWDTEDSKEAEVFENDAKVLDTVSWTWEETNEAFRVKCPSATGSGFCTLDNMLVVFGGQGKGPDFERTNSLFAECLSSIPLDLNPHEKRKGLGNRLGRAKRPKMQSTLHNCKRLTTTE